MTSFRRRQLGATLRRTVQNLRNQFRSFRKTAQTSAISVPSGNKAVNVSVTKQHDDASTRRVILKSGLALAGATAASAVFAKTIQPSPLASGVAATVVPRAPAAAVISPRVVRPELLRAALAALGKHGSRVRLRDRIAIADFAAPSSQPRFHFVDLADGSTKTLLVAHGSGSDPAHSGWLQRFSNAFNSNASCEGAFLTSEYYVGKHGKSQRLVGLDSSNDNALARAIVIHGAWYAEPGMIKTHGKLGRSQGCFAVAEHDLQKVFAHLGTGRMLYAAKV